MTFIEEQRTLTQESLKECKKLDKPPKLFLENLKQLLKKLAPAKLDTKTLGVLETDNFSDLLLSGTDVIGSCQRIGGDVEFNKCLTAYIGDGKNKIVEVKEKKGKIIARSILRLLVDADGKVVLVIEKVYANILDLRLEKALYKAALKKAEELGIPLLAVTTDKNSLDMTTKRYPSDVISLGGSAPYEYFDSGTQKVVARMVESGDQFTVTQMLPMSEILNISD